MNANSFGLDLAEEQILIDELSDEALERAGGLENSGRADNCNVLRPGELPLRASLIDCFWPLDFGPTAELSDVPSESSVIFAVTKSA